MDNISLNRFNSILLLFILIVIVFYFGKPFLIPVAFGSMLAMLLLPVCNWLERQGIKRTLAVLLSIMLILLFTAGMFAIISAQIISFSNDLPQMQDRMQQSIDNVQQWVHNQFGVAPQKQIAILKQTITRIFKSANSQVKGLITGLVGSLASFAIVLVYVFFLLWKREKYENFVLKLTQQENHEQVKETLHKITKVATEYLGGRLVSMALLAVFYMIGFSVVGLKNAVLLGLIAVIPTLIPYVGPIIGAFFPLAMALTSGDNGSVLPVFMVLAIAQALDNYFIEPFVLGSNLSLSPFMTIVSIIIGELLWGVAGMVLFIPLFAIVKIICDHVPVLHPYAYLLGEEDEGKSGFIDKMREWFRKKTGKAKQ